jgi:hypothetical protein
VEVLENQFLYFSPLGHGTLFRFKSKVGRPEGYVILIISAILEDQMITVDTGKI